MAGQHWGERDGKSSRVENTLIGIFSTLAALGFYGGLLLAAVALLRAETCTVNPRMQSFRKSCNSGDPVHNFQKQLACDSETWRAFINEATFHTVPRVDAE
jgi:hypothetical protein